MTTLSNHHPVVAAVDVGSNSVKMTVGRSNGSGGLDVLARGSETVRLGDNVASTGVLADDRMAAARKTLRDFAETARQFGAVRLIGVATEATRRASNGPAFLEQIREEIGWDLRVISGDEEAQLTFRGLATEIELSGSVVVADIGGGSTEVIIAGDGNVIHAESLRLGSGGLTERLVNSDPPTADELTACIGAATAKFTAIPLPPPRSSRLVTVGGTGEYLARLVADPGNIGPNDLASALQQCQSVTSHQLAVRIGAQQARARVLPAGLAIIQALANRIRPERIEVAQSGIRIGLLLATLDELSTETATHDEGGLQ